MRGFSSFSSHFSRPAEDKFIIKAIFRRENFINMNLTTFLPFGDEVQNAVICTSPVPNSLMCLCLGSEALCSHKMYFCCRHNDLAWNVRNFVHNQLQRFNFSADLRTVAPWATSSWSHTDLPRMQQGMLGAQVLTHQFLTSYQPQEGYLSLTT